MRSSWALTLLSLLTILVVLTLRISAEQCGSQAGGALCPGGLCCTQHGWCGTTPDYCAAGCQSQCGSGGGDNLTPGPSGGDISNVINKSMFNQMLLHRNDAVCPAKDFYTYEAFIATAKSFGCFGTTGDTATRLREIAAFFAQTSHETTGVWLTAADGPYSWGYCFLSEQGSPPDYCVADAQWPCALGKKYYGQGPIQISYNYNYGPAGKAIGVNLLNNPDLVASDLVVSFKTTLWFWMTPQSPKPSCHDVISWRWTPTAADHSAGRVPGFGVITNIINGGIECGVNFILKFRGSLFVLWNFARIT